MRARVATSTGSPARPARPRSRTTTVRSTSWRALRAGRAAHDRRANGLRGIASVQMVCRAPGEPTPANPAWTKVIGVLTERNWLADSGRIHGAGDHGPNPSAEIAFQVVARQSGALAMPRASADPLPRHAAARRAVVAARPAMFGAADVDVRRSVRALPHRHRGHAAPRDRAVGRHSGHRHRDRSFTSRAAARVAAGDVIQPAWSRFLDRSARPTACRLRACAILRAPGPLATLVVAYRS